jgi:hypothetical protein
LYNLSINFGEAIGPSMGGILTNFYSFEISCIATSSLNIFYALIFFLINYKTIKSYLFPESSKHEHKPLADNEEVEI